MVRQNQYFLQSAPHPGRTLEEKLEEMVMGPKEFALRTGKPEKTIIAIIKGDSSITADMAVQFESVTRIPANFWMNHQRNYDEFLAREKRKAVIQEAVGWAKQFPFKDALPKLKTISANYSDAFSRLQNICLEAGVKIVHTPRINKAPISGSTRWLNDTLLFNYQSAITTATTFGLLSFTKQDIFSYMEKKISF